MKVIKLAIDMMKFNLQKIRKITELRQYNRFTIAEYYRRQGAQIGEGCSIIPLTLGTEPYLVKIGNNVTIASGVIFMTHDGGVWIFRNEIPNIHVFGTITIEDNCVIGQNVILLPNIRIGANTIIGPNSVVINDIPANSIAIGVPARAMGSIDKYKEKCLVRWAEQCPPDYIVEEGANWWTSKHFHENRLKLKRHLIALFWGKSKTSF